MIWPFLFGVWVARPFIELSPLGDEQKRATWVGLATLTSEFMIMTYREEIIRYVARMGAGVGSVSCVIDGGTLLPLRSHPHHLPPPVLEK